MMKAGGTEIGKTLAEKSRGLFSANDWQCKTYVFQIIVHSFFHINVSSPYLLILPSLISHSDKPRAKGLNQRSFDCYSVCI